MNSTGTEQSPPRPTSGRCSNCPKRARCALVPRDSRRHQGARFCFPCFNSFFRDSLKGTVVESADVRSISGCQRFVEPVERQLQLRECGEGEAA